MAQFFPELKWKVIFSRFFVATLHLALLGEILLMVRKSSEHQLRLPQVFYIPGEVFYIPGGAGTVDT